VPVFKRDNDQMTVINLNNHPVIVTFSSLNYLSILKCLKFSKFNNYVNLYLEFYFKFVT